MLLLAACSDDPRTLPSPEPPPGASFEPVCGSDGPHRVLPLAAGEHAYGVDRVADDGPLLVSTFFVDPERPLASLPPTLDLAITAVGPCGEAPVELARGLALTTGHRELVLACGDQGHGAHVLDLEGGAPRPILWAWCPLRSTDAGLVAVEGGPDDRFGTLVLQRDPADPSSAPTVLADRIRSSRNTYFGPGSSSSTSLWAKGTEAVALAEDGGVWRFDLVTGQGQRELEGVRELRVSSDGRFMIWQVLEPAEGDPDTPVGPVFLRDRSRGTDAHLLNAHLEHTGNPYAGDYLVLRDDVEGLRVFRLGDGEPEPVALPEGTDYRSVLDGGALWLARKVDGETEELRWVPGEPAPTLMVRHGGVVSRRSDGFEIFEDDDVPAPSEGSLSFQPFDGGPMVRLADHVHASRGRLADGRILTIVGEDDTEHGPLRLIEPRDEAGGDGGWVQIDPRGFVQSPRLNNGDPLDGDVVYAIDGGATRERGVYRARVVR